MEVLNDLDKTGLHAVVLASGQSRRMHQNKLLMPLHHKKMIEYVLTLAKLPCFAGASVVTCYDEVEILADEYQLSVIRNRDSHLGQSASVVLGAKAAMQTNHSAMFLPADMPFLRGETIMCLADTYVKTCSIVVPRYEGQPGSPVIFPHRYLKELLNLSGDMGGKAIIQKHSDDVAYVDIADGQQGKDLDTMNQFIEAEAYLNGHK